MKRIAKKKETRRNDLVKSTTLTIAMIRITSNGKSTSCQIIWRKENNPDILWS